jgi:biotin synthase
VAVSGTPMGTNDTPTIWDMGRMIATARIVMPRSMVRLSAGELGLHSPLKHGHELLIVGLTLWVP